MNLICSLYDVDKVIKLPPLTVCDRAGDEILSLHKLLFVELTGNVTVNIVIPVTFNVPPFVVFPDVSTLNFMFKVVMVKAFTGLLTFTISIVYDGVALSIPTRTVLLPLAEYKHSPSLMV